MKTEHGGPYSEQGNRLRMLWLAERPGWTATAFAQWLGWPQSGYSQFETGARRVPLDKIQQLQARIPGFDANWFWSGDVERLGYDLRQRIKAVMGRESSRNERQDV